MFVSFVLTVDNIVLYKDTYWKSKENVYVVRPSDKQIYAAQNCLNGTLPSVLYLTGVD